MASRRSSQVPVASRHTSQVPSIIRSRRPTAELVELKQREENQDEGYGSMPEIQKKQQAVASEEETTTSLDSAKAQSSVKRSSSEISNTSLYSSTDIARLKAKIRNETGPASNFGKNDEMAVEKPFDPFTTALTIDRGTQKFRPVLVKKSITVNASLNTITESTSMTKDEFIEEDESNVTDTFTSIDTDSDFSLKEYRLISISEESLPYHTAGPEPDIASPMPLGSSKTIFGKSSISVLSVLDDLQLASNQPSSLLDSYSRHVEDSLKNVSIDDPEPPSKSGVSDGNHVSTVAGSSAGDHVKYRAPTQDKKKNAWYTPFLFLNRAQTSNKNAVSPSAKKSGETISPAAKPQKSLDFAGLGGVIRKQFTKSKVSTKATNDNAVEYELPEMKSTPASDKGSLADQNPRKSFYDKYSILKRLGAGGHSTVHLAKNRKTGQNVVIKIFYGNTVWHWHGDAKPYIPLEIHLMEAFSRTKGSLISPKFIEYFNFGEEYIIVMEYLGEGWTDLYEYLETHGYLPEGRVLEIFRNVLRQISVLYRLGYTHNDIKGGVLINDSLSLKLRINDGGVIKPKTDENIMIHHETLETRLIDFGSATRTDSETIHSEIYGTKKFACPESLRDCSYSPLAQESWALGALLYILCFQVDPFASTDEVFTVNMNSRLLRSQSIAKFKGYNYCHKMLAVIQKCMSMNPAQRYSLVDLEQIFLTEKWLP